MSCSACLTCMLEVIICIGALDCGAVAATPIFTGPAPAPMLIVFKSFDVNYIGIAVRHQSTCSAEGWMVLVLASIESGMVHDGPFGIPGSEHSNLQPIHTTL